MNILFFFANRKFQTSHYLPFRNFIWQVQRFRISVDISREHKTFLQVKSRFNDEIRQIKSRGNFFDRRSRVIVVKSLLKSGY